MDGQKFYSIGEAAKRAGTTIETLRHYDRTGLLKPARTDPGSGYRYYTDTELIYLEVISFCRKNKMPLGEIKRILNADFPQVVAFLQEAERNIGVEMQRLSRAQEQISALRQSLQAHAVGDTPGIYTKEFAQRAVLPAAGLRAANVENFRRLHGELYRALEPAAKEAFAFDHTANLLLTPPKDMGGTMFAVCTRYCAVPNLRFLGAGTYLCCGCTEGDKDERVLALWRAAKETHRADPQYAVLHVEFTGLFRWRYEVQVPLF